MQEEWRTIDGFPDYEVSNEGRVRSLPRVIVRKDDALYHAKGRILRAGTHTGGYKVVSLYAGVQRPVTKHVHRLVAIAFLPNPDALPEVNHENLDKADNHVTNLTWCTGSENQRHAAGKGCYHGRTNSKFWRKLTPMQVDEILTLTGSSTEVARLYGVSSALILKIRRGTCWADPAQVYVNG